MAVARKKDIPMPAKYFTAIGGFSEEEWKTFVSQNAAYITTVIGAEDNYNVFEIMALLMAERRVLKKNQKTRSAQGNSFEDELSKEKLLEARIKNQKILGTLIAKSEARVRIKQAWAAVRNKILYSAKMAAQYSVGMMDPRQVETIMIREYNKAINSLRDETDIVSWDADGSTELLRTRVMSITEEAEETKALEELAGIDLDEEADDGQDQG